VSLGRLAAKRIALGAAVSNLLGTILILRFLVLPARHRRPEAVSGEAGGHSIFNGFKGF
jgi:hypothetical protein